MSKFFDVWPKYVKTIEHHSNGIYLVQSKEELIELMLSTMTRWYEDDEFGEQKWYTFESFEAFFADRMGGMSLEVFNTHILPLTDHNGYIRSLKESGSEMKRRYDETLSYLADLKFMERLVNGERPSGFANRLYAILSDSEYDGKPRFVVDNFDSI